MELIEKAIASLTEKQYKYLVAKDGATWEWFSAANYNMPVDLVANDTETYVEPDAE